METWSLACIPSRPLQYLTELKWCLPLDASVFFSVPTLECSPVLLCVFFYCLLQPRVYPFVSLRVSLPYWRFYRPSYSSSSFRSCTCVETQSVGCLLFLEKLLRLARAVESRALFFLLSRSGRQALFILFSFLSTHGLTFVQIVQVLSLAVVISRSDIGITRLYNFSPRVAWVTCLRFPLLNPCRATLRSRLNCFFLCFVVFCCFKRASAYQTVLSLYVEGSWVFAILSYMLRVFSPPSI